MTTLVAYTPAERKREFDLKYKHKNEIKFVIDPEYRGQLPIIEKSENGFDIVCTEYQKFLMSRRDDGEYWEHFYISVGIPRSYDPEVKK